MLKLSQPRPRLHEGTTVSMRFQWPPRQTAETIRPVRPQGRYSMLGL